MREAVIPPTGVTPLMTASSQIYSSLGQVFRHSRHMSSRHLSLKTLSEYLRLVAAFHEVGPWECLRGAYSNGEKGVRCAR